MLIWISWFHVWIFLFVQINLTYPKERKNDLQNTVLLGIYSQYVCMAYICVYNMSLCFSRCVICVVWNIYSPNLQQQTKKVPSRQNGKFYFQTKIERHLTSRFLFSLKFLPEILWNCASFLAWNVFHAMFHFTFFLCKLFQKRTKKKVPKRIQMYTNDFPNVTFIFIEWTKTKNACTQCKEIYKKKKKKKNNFLEHDHKRKMKLWF